MNSLWDNRPTDINTELQRALSLFTKVSPEGYSRFPPKCGGVMDGDVTVKEGQASSVDGAGCDGDTVVIGRSSPCFPSSVCT